MCNPAVHDVVRWRCSPVKLPQQCRAGTELASPMCCVYCSPPQGAHLDVHAGAAPGRNCPSPAATQLHHLGLALPTYLCEPCLRQQGGLEGAHILTLPWLPPLALVGLEECKERWCVAQLEKDNVVCVH
jgi:hypothetical protein